MAVFTAEQLATITAAEVSLDPLRVALRDATNLLVSLRDLDASALVNGEKVDEEAVFNSAIATWGEIRARLIAAADALP